MNADAGLPTRSTRPLCASVLLALALMLVSTVLPARLSAQDKPAGAKKEKKEPKEPKAEKEVPAFFRSETPLSMTLTTNIKQIRKDKGEDAPYRWATLTYDSAGKPAQMPLKVRTRGIWRLRNCTFPPIRLNFSDKATKHTLFDDLENPKLVSYCKDNDSYEQYILQEFQLYRIYQLLTPVSHRVRLVEARLRRQRESEEGSRALRDRRRGPEPAGEPQSRENRQGQGRRTIGSRAEGAGPRLHVRVPDRQSRLLLQRPAQHRTARHDGRAHAARRVRLRLRGRGEHELRRAARPDYGVPNVRTRKFMGYCEIRDEFPAAVAVLQEKKDAIYALYHDDIGKLMKPDVVRETLEYFDDFYKDVRTPNDAKRLFDRCIRRG